MLHDLSQILWVHGIQDVEKVVAWWAFALWENGREVGSEGSIFLELGPERLDTELIIMGHGNVINLLFLHQMLSAGEDVLEEVLVDRFFTGQIVLFYKGVRDKG